MMLAKVKIRRLCGFIAGGVFLMAITAANAIDQPMTGYVQIENTTDATSKGAVSSDITLTVAPLGPASGPRIAITGSADRYRYWADAERSFLGTGGDTQRRSAVRVRACCAQSIAHGVPGPVFIIRISGRGG